MPDYGNFISNIGPIDRTNGVIVTIMDFPPIEFATDSGLLAVGGDLQVSSLLLAYSKGIFPWPHSKNGPMAWYSPDPRGVLYTDNLKINRSLNKFIKKCPYNFSINKAFNDVILNCSENPNRAKNGTWITDDIINAYINLFERGFAYSIEVWDQSQLVGGLYGVNIGHYFSGESMFFLKDNASKLALIYIIQILRSKNIPFLDTQMVTPIIESMGGREIPRSYFIDSMSDLFKTNQFIWKNIPKFSIRRFD